MPRLDITSLVPVIQELCATGIAPVMERVYRTGGGWFINFCNQANLLAYPMSKRILMLFVIHMYTQNLAHGIIQIYMAAVCHGQIFRGLGDPQIHQMPQLEYLLKGIKKSTPQSRRTRLPIIPQVLMDLKRVWHKAGNKEVRLLWAAAWLCFLIS